MNKSLYKRAGGLCLCMLLCLLAGCTQSTLDNVRTGDPVTSVAATPLPLSGVIIGIDPGHQAKPDHDQEFVAPGSTNTKAKVSTGTRGLVSGVYEYEVNLQVALKLKALLQGLGATVVMTRESNDVNISNSQRAELFNEYKTDYAIRLHCNGREDTAMYGAYVIIPADNPYQSDCERAARLLIDAYCARTGLRNLGFEPRSDQTGFNFCNRTILNIEMGYLTNAGEESKLIDGDFQQDMAQGIVDGILLYFDKSCPDGA